MTTLLREVDTLAFRTIVVAILLVVANGAAEVGAFDQSGVDAISMGLWGVVFLTLFRVAKGVSGIYGEYDERLEAASMGAASLGFAWLAIDTPLKGTEFGEFLQTVAFALFFLSAVEAAFSLTAVRDRAETAIRNVLPMEANK